MTTPRKPPRTRNSRKPPTRVPAGEARERILDAAEWIFAHQGAQALSMRAITSRARINVAGAHYYFGSKQGLILELVRRRFEPINRRRVAMLDEAIAAVSPQPPSLEAIVDAFALPMLRIGASMPSDRAETVRRFVGRVAFLPPEIIGPVFPELFDPVVQRFHRALQDALPELDAGDIFWRMHLSVGPLLRVLVQAHVLPQMAGTACPDETIEQIQARLRSFICAGLRAAPVKGAGAKNPKISASTTSAPV